MRLRARRGLVFAASALFALSGCGGSTAASPTTAAAVSGSITPSAEGSAPASSASPSAIDMRLSGTAYAPATPATTAPHGTLVVGESIPVDTLNRWFSGSAGSIGAIQPAMRGFLAITSDGKYIADLATKVPTVDNGAVSVHGSTFDITVTLKPGLEWSDGTPLTMDDYVATWKWATDPAQVGCVECAVGWPDIGSIDESTDKLTATIHFKHLYTGWLGFLTSGPWPAKYLASVPIADAATLYPFGPAIASVPMDGPFTITSASTSEIDYAANPHWAGGVSSAHAPYLAGLRLVSYADKTGEIADFKAGKLDLAFDIAVKPAYAAFAAVDPSIGRATSDVTWAYEHLDLNNDPTHARGQDLWDPAVRAAMAMAIDKQALIKVLFPGQPVEPACSPIPPSLWYAVVETCPTYDPKASITALTAAGLAIGPDGFFQYQGRDIDLEMCTTSGIPLRLAILQEVQRELAEVHVKSHIRAADANSALFAPWAQTTVATDCSLARGTFDVADFAYLGLGNPYDDFDPAYSTDQWPEKGDHSGQNDTRFSDPAVDAALTTLRTAIDPQAQAAGASTIQGAYVKGTPEIALFYRAAATGVGVHAGNWPGFDPAASVPGGFGPFWNVEDWYDK